MDGMSTGIYEQKDPIYSLREQDEEDKLFQINESTRSLLAELENHKEKKDESKAQ